MSQPGGLLGHRITREHGRASIFAFILTSALVVPIVIPVGWLLYMMTGLVLPEAIALPIGALFAATVFFAARWSFRFWSSRFAPPRAQVMWLRRFQAEGRGVFQTSRVIDQLARHGLSAITLQDRDVPESWERRLNRRAPVFWALFIVMVLVLIAALGGMLGQVRSSLGNTSDLAAAGFASILIIGIGMFAVLGFVLALGVIFLMTLMEGPVRRFWSRNRDDFSKLPKLLDRIRHGKHPSGALIVRIGDNNWREAVRLALGVVDAVIIDITDVTDAIAWEVTQALEVCGRGSLVFIARQDAPIQPTLSVKGRATIQNALGNDICDLGPIRYPASRKVPRTESFRFARELREALYVAAEASKPTRL